MPLTNTQLTTLRNEIQGDPATYGYAALASAGNHQAITDLLNKVRDGTDGEAAITVRRRNIRPVEILEAVAVSDLPAIQSTPTANQQVTHQRNFAYLTWLMGLADDIRLVNDDGSDTQVRTNLLALFAAGTGTRTRLGVLSQRNGSRSELLFGTDTVVSVEDVGRALAG